MEFLIKHLGDIRKYTGLSPLLCGRKTSENEKPVANQMPGFVGAGSWDLFPCGMKICDFSQISAPSWELGVGRKSV
jgi:hypothetical protein